MKKAHGILAALAALALAACGQPENQSATSAPAAPKAAPAAQKAAPAAAKAPAANQQAQAPAAKAEAGAPKFVITAIPKGTANPFWKTVHAGAAKAAKEFNVKLNWLGPENEDDRLQQIQLVNSVIASGVNGLVLAPLDDTALVASVETAVTRKIPVVIIDSALKSTTQSSFVATDNRQGGREAAKLLGAAMGGAGKAIMMRYNQGSASTQEREEGFLEVMAKEFPKIELVSTNQYAGVTKQSAMDTGVNLLTKYGKDIQGIYCPNESSAAGMLQALKNTGYAGKLKFIGFDASEALIQGMRDGAIQGLVAQDPFGMGYLGVKTAVEVLEGKPVKKQVNTNLVKITPQNLETKEIQALIKPELTGM